VPLLIIIIGITYFAFPHVVMLFKNIQTDFKSLLPKNYDNVQRMEKVSKLFGNRKNMEIILETKNAEATKKFIPKLSRYIESDPDVERVYWQKPGYDFFDEHKLFFMSKSDLKDLSERIDRRIQREKLGSMYIDFDDDSSKKDTFGDIKNKYSKKFSGKITSRYFTNNAENVFIVVVFPKSRDIDVKYFKKFGTRIKKMVAKFDIQKYDSTAKAHYTGGIITFVHEYDSLIRDLKIAGTISSITILLLILIYFRTFRSILFVSIPLTCGIIWNFAIDHLVIGHLNMTTAFIFSILFGLGIDFGIHFNARYDEERRNGATLNEALFTMLQKTGRASLTAAITTAAAFLVLSINDFKGFSEFGVIAGVGILVALISYIVILPPMLAMEEKLSILRRKKFPKEGWKIIFPAGFAPQRTSYIFVIMSIVGIILAAAFLHFNYNFTNLRAPSPDIDKAQQLDRKVSPNRAVPSLILVHSKKEAKDAEQAVKILRDKNSDTLINYTASIYDLIPEHQAEKIPFMRNIKKLLTDDTMNKLIKGRDKEKIEGLRKSANANPFTIKDIPKEFKKKFLANGEDINNQLVYIFLKPSVDLKDGKLAIKLADDIRDIPAPSGHVYHAISSSIIFANVLSLMIKDSSKAIAMSFIIVFILLFFDFKSFKTAAITMIPLIGGVCVMLGTMTILGMSFNFFNMIVLPVIFGIGIDNSVHFFHRYQEENYDDMEKVLSTTGGAIIMTTLTTAAGFFGMCFAHHKGLFSIGTSASIGMLACLMATIIFFPALLKILMKRRSAG